MAKPIVYIIGTAVGSPVKIGTSSRSVDARLWELQAASHEKYVPLRIVPGGRLVETWFHERFASCRISREWFRFDADMLTVEPMPTNPYPTDGIDTDTCAGLILDFIRRRYGPLENGKRLLAADAGTVPRTAELWLAGVHSPNGEKLVNLLAMNDDLFDAFIQLIHRRRASLARVQ